MFDFQLFKGAFEKHVIVQKHIDFEISAEVLLRETQEHVDKLLIQVGKLVVRQIQDIETSIFTDAHYEWHQFVANPHAAQIEELQAVIAGNNCFQVFNNIIYGNFASILLLRLDFYLFGCFLLRRRF